MVEYLAGDGLPLKIGDRVTKLTDTPNSKHAFYLIEGVVLEEKFGYEERGRPTCRVMFEEASEERYKMTDCCCLMEHLVHLEFQPEYTIPDFENMFCAMLGMK